MVVVIIASCIILNKSIRAKLCKVLIDRLYLHSILYGKERRLSPMQICMPLALGIQLIFFGVLDSLSLFIDTKKRIVNNSRCDSHPSKITCERSCAKVHGRPQLLHEKRVFRTPLHFSPYKIQFRFTNILLKIKKIQLLHSKKNT